MKPKTNTKGHIVINNYFCISKGINILALPDRRLWIVEQFVQVIEETTGEIKRTKRSQTAKFYIHGVGFGLSHVK